MPRTGLKQIGDDDLATRAAWLHYVAGLTQGKVADRLGLSKVKVNRLISRANKEGAVKFSVEGEVAECLSLETELTDLFGLQQCQVVPNLFEEGLPLKALGAAGAQFLHQEIENRQGGLIGIGHGRTLAASVAQMRRVDAGTVRFVSLFGGLTRNYAANPHDVMHRLADKTGATSYVMPVPFFANSAQDREVLLSQRGVIDVFDLAARSDLMFVGVGTAKLEAQLVASQMIDPSEIGQIQRLGGVGELLGHFFDARGNMIETPLTARTLAQPLQKDVQNKIVAISGGDEKIEAINAVLKSGFVSGLITDENSAETLLKRFG